MVNDEQHPLIYNAMADVMADISGVAKRDRNTGQNFMFRGIDAVLNAVGPVLRKHSVIVVPRVQSVDYAAVTTTNNKPATACRVDVTYAFITTDGSSLECRVVGEAWDHGDKATPKAMSVAMRTALIQALALPTDEPDPDAQTYEQAQVDYDAVLATAQGLTDVDALRDLWTRERVGQAPVAVRDAFSAHVAAVAQRQAATEPEPGSLLNGGVDVDKS